MKCTVEFRVYVKEIQHKNLVLVYVDDLIVTRNVQTEIKQFKVKIKLEFEMSNLRTLNYFVGLEFLHTPKGILLHQKKYTCEVLKRFNMEDCNVALTPVIANLKLIENLDHSGFYVTTVLILVMELGW